MDAIGHFGFLPRSCCAGRAPAPRPGVREHSAIRAAAARCAEGRSRPISGGTARCEVARRLEADGVEALQVDQPGRGDVGAVETSRRSRRRRSGRRRRARRGVRSAPAKRAPRSEANSRSARISCAPVKSAPSARRVVEHAAHQPHRLVAHVGGEVGADEARPGQVGVGEVGDRPGAGQVGAAQVGAAELRLEELRAAQARALQGRRRAARPGRAPRRRAGRRPGRRRSAARRAGWRRRSRARCRSRPFSRSRERSAGRRRGGGEPRRPPRSRVSSASVIAGPSRSTPAHRALRRRLAGGQGEAGARQDRDAHRRPLGAAAWSPAPAAMSSAGAAAPPIRPLDGIVGVDRGAEEDQRCSRRPPRAPAS